MWSTTPSGCGALLRATAKLQVRAGGEHPSTGSCRVSAHQVRQLDSGALVWRSLGLFDPFGVVACARQAIIVVAVCRAEYRIPAQRRCMIH